MSTDSTAETVVADFDPQDTARGENARQPERIGKYEVRGVAGHGAMGTVYVGYDAFIDRRVAIKVCDFKNEDEDSVARARKMNGAGGATHGA